MAILPMVYIPNDVLKTKAEEVKTVNDEIRTMLDNMVDTMYHYNGIGLAANQVGILHRITVIDVADENENSNLIKMVNPIITYKSDKMNTYSEGCLSIPTGEGKIERPEEIEVEYLDENGGKKNIRTGGLLATCIQHEIDHLDGILFIDYLSKIKRDMVKRKVEKHLKAGGV